MIEFRDEVAEMLDEEFGLDVTVEDSRVVGSWAQFDVITVEWDERGEFKITAQAGGEQFVWEQDSDDEDDEVAMFVHMAMQDADWS